VPISTTFSTVTGIVSVPKAGVVAVIVVAAVGAYYYNASQEQVAGDIMVIGTAGPVTGQYAIFGDQMVRGAQMAVEDINAAGGVLGCDIKVVIADTEGLPEKASAIMEKLITQDGVVAVGGGYHSSVGVASKDVANNRKVPVVFAETWNDTITGDKQKYIFRIAPLSSWASSTLWKAALLAPNVK